MEGLWVTERIFFCLEQNWRATYVSTLAPILRIDLGAWGKSKRTSEEASQAREDGDLGQGVASGENLEDRI